MGEAQQLAQPADFDFLPRVVEHYATLRRYAPAFLAALPLRAAPATRPLLAAIDVLRGMNATGGASFRLMRRRLSSASAGRSRCLLRKDGTAATASCAPWPNLKMRCAQAIFGCWVRASSRTLRGIGTGGTVCRPAPSR